MNCLNFILRSGFVALSISLATLRAADAGFVSIFNGKDLTGWEGNTKLWSVKDGAIVGRTLAEDPLKSNTFLIWKGGEVANFELHAKFRLTSQNEKKFANSGIQYRSKIVDPAGWVVAGFQADMDFENVYTGMIYEEKGRGILAKPGEQVTVSPGATEKKPKIEVTGATLPAAELKPLIHQADWNEYVIIAEGNHLRQYVNGKMTCELTDLDPKGAKSGVVALQVHVGGPMTVEFKEIKLKTLP
jgi:hypothetical protein